MKIFTKIDRRIPYLRNVETPVTRSFIDMAELKLLKIQFLSFSLNNPFSIRQIQNITNKSIIEITFLYACKISEM